MMNDHDKDLSAVLQTAAALIAKRDALAGELHWIDHKITDACRAYGDHVRTWGWTPTMMRQALKARGYFKECDAA